MYDDLTYGDLYYYQHNVHFVDVMANMFAGAFGVSAYGDAQMMVVRVYNVDLDVMRQLVADLNLGHVVNHVSYATDYDYYDNPVADTDCVVLYCNYNLYDLDD